MGLLLDDVTIEEMGSTLDAAGRAWSPFMERGDDLDGAPTSVRVPSPHELRVPKTPAQSAELDRLNQRFFGAATPDIEGETRARYLTRFNITPSDPRWAAENERLQTSQRGRVQLAQARRLTERYETLAATGGDLGAMTVYIAEGEDPCEECVVLAGGEMTYGERIEAGDMPSDRCLGGDLCQCTLGVIQ